MRIYILALVLFPAILNSSCHQTDQSDKKKQPVSQVEFNSQEIEKLYNFVDIFDQIICDGDCLGEYNLKYRYYLDSLSATNLTNLIRDFSKQPTINELRLAVRKLKMDGLFSEVWDKDEMVRMVGAPNKPFSSDSVVIWQINTKGKYAEFLSMIGRSNPVIKQYDNIVLREGGTIGPGAMAIMLGRDENTLNFEDKSVRLIFAVHWITYLTEWDGSFLSKLDE